MTVAELIEKLKEFPQDAKVFVGLPSPYEGHYGNLDDPFPQLDEDGQVIL